MLVKTNLYNIFGGNHIDGNEIARGWYFSKNFIFNKWNTLTIDSNSIVSHLFLDATQRE